MPARKDYRPGKREEMAERVRKVFELRKSGLSYRAIAEHLGYDIKTVHSDSMKRLKQINAESNELAIEMRTLEGERLDHMQSVIWGDVLRGDLQAIQTVLRIMDKRAKLFGLDVAITQDITINGQLLGGITEEDRRAILELATPIFPVNLLPDPNVITAEVVDDELTNE